MFSVYVQMGKLSIILSCRFSFWNDQNSNKMHAVQKNGIVFTVHTQRHGTHTHTHSHRITISMHAMPSPMRAREFKLLVLYCAFFGAFGERKTHRVK